jgi:hypothetical protein
VNGDEMPDCPVESAIADISFMIPPLMHSVGGSLW